MPRTSRRGGGSSSPASPAQHTIFAPVTDFEGSVAGVAFVKGRGETADPRALAYFRRRGYGIGRKVEPPAKEDRPIPAAIQTVGTKLRDAAVDPRKRDFLPPVNAGKANPHGPFVVAPEIHGPSPKGIRPGDVHVGNPAAQDAAESALAEEVLLQGAPATEAVPDAGDTDAIEAPAKNASADDWRAFAIAQGMDADEAEKASRAELIERYGDAG